MAVTHKLIETVTVGSGGAANITFTSIPQTYTDLKVVYSLRQTNSSVVLDIQFNGLSTNLSSRLLVGSGSAASSVTSASTIRAYGTNPSDYTALIFSNLEVYIPNYSGSTNKSVSMDYVTENNGTGGFVGFTAGLWNATAAITQIALIASGGNLVQYSSASLYGIKNS
jgi:hypothetical protein